MLFKRFAILGAAGSAVATMSLCDKYTTALLTDDTPANQYLLLTLLVNTVVIGNYTMPNVGIAVPGILAPATYNGESVNLLPYFNGCLESSNVGGMPASVNFLDGGGAAPLMMNLPANSPDSNQYGLLTHLYQFFGILLGCSGVGQPGFPNYMGDPSMGRVHRFMQLDPAEVGYFISQVGLAAASFGVSAADVSTVGGALMMYFGYKCSPPVDIVYGPQADSICQDPSCPIDPHPACWLYPSEPPPMTAPQCAAPPPATTTKYESKTKSYTKETKTWGY